MSQVTYQYAIDESGLRVHISDIEPATHRGRIFKCISCGRDLIAKIGNHEKAHSRAPHFAHKQTCECSKENYLHKLGKQMFKERFESGEPIYIKSPTLKVCPNRKTCALYYEKWCSKEEEQMFNLHNWYDTCTEEKEYDGYRADLLLESSEHPERAPLFIEIVYTHKCSRQKIESKNKIIEIDVNDEYQLEQIIKGVFEEDDDVRLYNFEKKPTDVLPECSRYLGHFILYASGDAYVNSVTCTEAKTLHTPNAEIEFIIDQRGRSITSYYTTDDIGFLLASDAGCNVMNCLFCKYHSTEGYGHKKQQLVCNVLQKQMLPCYPQQTDARTCKYFRRDEIIITDIRKDLNNHIKYWKLPLE